MVEEGHPAILAQRCDGSVSSMKSSFAAKSKNLKKCCLCDCPTLSYCYYNYYCCC